MNSSVAVAAAVIRRNDRFLLGLRPEGKRHGGRWEFPGGKLRAGETLEGALARELREELELRLERVGPVLFTAMDEGTLFEISFVQVDVLGSPRAVEHAAIGWHSLKALSRLHLAPADLCFVRECLRPDSPPLTGR